MSSHKHHEHLNRIKEAVQGSKDFNETEKTDTVKRIEEWLLEDKATGTFKEELLELTIKIKPILQELGLL
ncbi:hypothetical protein JHD47_03220 [Sulfurimonas sp. SAG-AH-194-L11]|nr:hypothetical protein [Sulfurimonas sp. SAG-AH-194-L11]MDF1876823.1 hypothetical protein [Sulfurimonas sp. SAG-AH-194-L11]